MSINTQSTEWTEKAENVVYSVWQQNLAVQSTGQTNVFGQLHVSHHGSETSVNYDEDKIQQAGRAWGDLKGGKDPLTTRSTTRPTDKIGLFDLWPCFLDVDYQAIEYCIEKAIMTELRVYCRSVAEAFSNIDRLSIHVVRDHEIENYQKVRFDLAVSGDVESILRQETEFRRRIVARVLPDKRAHFVLALRIV